MDFVELDLDQRREAVNTAQRFAAWRDAARRVSETRGSMTWSRSKERDYLMRSAYDKHGRRRQRSLGPRSEETEAVKARFEAGRSEAKARLDSLRTIMIRQASINRALGLGRVPLAGARLLREIDDAGLLGHGLRVLGTNALYAYEAVAGVHIGGEFLATGDVDLLLDARERLSIATDDGLDGASILALLRRSDRSFERTPQTFRAANRDGYLVDLIKPLRNPPWTSEPTMVGRDASDLDAVEIEGLAWHESAPPFQAVVMDVRGEPLRMITSDPRVFAAHKLWLSRRADRDPLKRRRDAAQAAAVAALVATHMAHLPYERSDLQMLPRAVFDAAAPLFRQVDGQVHGSSAFAR